MDISVLIYGFLTDMGFSQFLVLSIFIGTFVGSFSNVVIHRLPIMMEKEWREACEIEMGVEPIEKETYNLSIPRSCCPQCNTKIAWYDNIPIISWIFLKGKCRHCNKKISFIYPLVEFFSGFTAGLFAYILWPSPMAIVLPLLIITAIVLLFIDIKHMLLPDSITLSMLWGGLILSVIGISPLTPSESIMGAFSGYAFLWTVSRIVYLWKGVDGLGFGDIKYISAVGAWVGAYTLLHLVTAICFLAIVMFGVMWLIDKIVDKDNVMYNEYKELEASTKKDLGMDEEFKNKRIMPFGPSISIVFIAWLMIQYIV
jgi:leader peptidase (prepilin peptidase)/N-methyltransferase